MEILVRLEDSLTKLLNVDSKGVFLAATHNPNGSVEAARILLDGITSCEASYWRNGPKCKDASIQRPAISNHGHVISPMGYLNH
jgi:hypothetical protein